MSSFSAPKSLYQIVLSDNSSDLYMYGIPSPTDIPRVLYRSLQEVMPALRDLVSKFDKFIPVAYGEAYPYEGTTFEDYLNEKEVAPYGWVVLQSDNEEPPVRIGIYLLKLEVV